MAHKAAEPRGSVVMNRLRSMRSSIAPVAPIVVASDADTADEESGFRSVVRLGAPHGPVSLCAHWLVMPCGPRLAVVDRGPTAEARHHRCLRMPMRARSSIRLSPQSPFQLPRRSARLCMMRVVPKVTLEVPEVCTVAACCLLLTRFAIGYFADVCRSPLQRAAAREICLHMRRDPNTSYLVCVCVAVYNRIDRR
jgi:hypothetical protein